MRSHVTGFITVATAIEAIARSTFGGAFAFSLAAPPSLRSSQSHHYHVSLVRRAAMRNSNIDSVDYSSTRGWEALYQEHSELQGCQKKKIDNNNNDPSSVSTTSSAAIVEEWHSSISLETIADLILMAVRNGNDGSCPGTGSVIIMIGCGTSHLPSVLLDRCGKEHDDDDDDDDAIHQVILVDSSPTCLQLLRQRYESMPSFCNKLTFLCADVTQPSWYASTASAWGTHNSPTVLLDKGLLDALFCGDAWERPVQAVLHECYNILSSQLQGRGCYILVSYKLPRATQAFLAAISKLPRKDDGDRKTNNDDDDQHHPLFQWDFDVPEYSTDRVSVSIGRTL